MCHVLRKWLSANTETEVNLALMWFLFLPQALLRKPVRGGRAGRQMIAKRFNCIVKGDWGSLIDLWESDKVSVSGSRRRGNNWRQSDNSDQLEKKRREVVSLISGGQISRAMQRANSHGLGKMSDESIMEQVKAKYPVRGRPLPDRVLKGQPVSSLRGLRESLQSLLPGSSPGSGGMRPEFLQTLAFKMSEEEMLLLEDFGSKYLSGDLPHWFYAVWLTVQTVPIFKTSQQSTVRPLGLRNPLLKAFHRQVVTQNKAEVREYLEPQQLGLSVSGAQKLVFSVRGLLNQRRDFICVKIDFRNAYNEQSRRAIIDSFLQEPSLSHLAHFCAVTLAPVNGLESGGIIWGEAAEGDTQGDPAASMRFCVGLQPSLARLDDACQQGEGMARGGADDITAVGPAHIVLPAVVQFAAEVKERCLLHWERTKSEVFSWDGILPPNTPEGLTLAAEEVEGSLEPGFVLWGVPIGSDQYTSHKLQEIAQGIVSDAQQTADLLSGERQSLWSALRLSILHQFDYWLQLSYPSVVTPVARWLDTEIWKILETATGLSIPRQVTDMDGECILPVPVTGRGLRTFQEWAVRQPIRLGGFGVRSMEDTAGVAFLGSLEKTIPTLTGSQGICPQLETVMGGEECFGEDAPTDSRWRVLLQSGCREGLELQSVWFTLQNEERQSAAWLDREVHETLAVSVEGVGGSNTDGSTRGKITEARDITKGRLIRKALEIHPNQDRNNRPVWAWLQRDKLSSAWLQALPGPNCSLSSAEFSEAASAALCLPSPVCRDRVGQTVRGREVVDKYGDSIQSATLPGDHFRGRHDGMKIGIFQMSKWAGLPCEMEVFNLFAGSIPQAGLRRGEG